MPSPEHGASTMIRSKYASNTFASDCGLSFVTIAFRMKFCTRCCGGFIQAAAENRGKTVAFVVHGGTIMAIAERFAFPKKGFYDYQVKNGGGYTAELDHGKITITSEF